LPFVPEPIRASSDTTQTPWSASPRANGLPTPPLEKICQLVLPYREAIASPKLVPEHQHDQRGRESFFASQGDLYLLVFALAGERDRQAARGPLSIDPDRERSLSLAPWFRSTGAAIAGKSITERLCVFRLDEAEHHKIELAAAQGFAAC